MRHHIFGRKLGRDIKERNALFRSLIDALITHGKIETTLAKARAIRSETEKLVTHARNGTVSAKRKISFFVPKKSSFDRLMNDIGPRFMGRPGGYLRMHRIQTRPGDNGQKVVLEWVTAASQKSEITEKTQKPEETKKSVPKTTKKSARKSST